MALRLTKIPEASTGKYEDLLLELTKSSYASTFLMNCEDLLGIHRKLYGMTRTY